MLVAGGETIKEANEVYRENKVEWDQLGGIVASITGDAGLCDIYGLVPRIVVYTPHTRERVAEEEEPAGGEEEPLVGSREEKAVVVPHGMVLCESCGRVWDGNAQCSCYFEGPRGYDHTIYLPEGGGLWRGGLSVWEEEEEED